ncbi:MAG: hypothetical protein A2X46_06545 [Lentisphaerae bacterium GWF2_57_35]|nr:MAG: hypothetical protein A2X46_06545 [Lentisphaerae bacterium GWF2_57_35]
MIERSITRIDKLSDADKEMMFHLHRKYFCHVVHEIFLKDMNEKEWAIVLREGRNIVGFSSLMMLHHLLDGEKVSFIFSGDTIVDQRYWQTSAIAGSFGHYMLRMIAEHRHNLYWFLISKGYRTYRFLPVFFNQFYPIHNAPTPDAYQRLLNLAATYKFGHAYDPETGIIKMGRKKDWLRPVMCEIPESRQNDPHVGFFLQRNPTYSQGDELACITQVAECNFNKYAWRVIRQNHVRWDE